MPEPPRPPPQSPPQPTPPPLPSYQQWEARVRFWRDYAIPAIRDVVLLTFGIALLVYLVLTSVTLVYPYVIVIALLGFPGWARVLAPALFGQQPPPAPAPPTPPPTQFSDPGAQTDGQP